MAVFIAFFMQNWVMVHNLRLKYLHMKKSIIHNFIFLTTKRPSNNIWKRLSGIFMVYWVLKKVEVSQTFPVFCSIIFCFFLVSRYDESRADFFLASFNSFSKPSICFNFSNRNKIYPLLGYFFILIKVIIPSSSWILSML